MGERRGRPSATHTPARGGSSRLKNTRVLASGSQFHAGVSFDE